MIKRGTRAELYINDHPVGEVVVRGADASWHFGDFSPADGFTNYALPFGRWSLLMHAQDDDDRARMDAYALDELRRLEYAIDSLHAKLHIPERDEWHRIAQLNIDGPLIEWKEY